MSQHLDRIEVPDDPLMLGQVLLDGAGRHQFVVDALDCSVFAPSSVAPGQSFLLQILLHDKPGLVKAAQMARTLDSSAGRRGFASLEIPITRGATVDLLLDCPNLVVDTYFASLIWKGQPERAVFNVKVPRGTSRDAIAGTVIASIDGVPVGEVAFSVFVAETTRAAPMHGLADMPRTDPAEPHYIVTVWGVGYRFGAEQIQQNA